LGKNSFQNIELRNQSKKVFEDIFQKDVDLELDDRNFMFVSFKPLPQQTTFIL